MELVNGCSGLGEFVDMTRLTAIIEKPERLRASEPCWASPLEAVWAM